LYCFDNQLTGLDVLECVLLKFLRCDGNPIETLDVSTLEKLIYLESYNSDFTKDEVDKILGDLPLINDGRGTCIIKYQNGVFLDGLIDISDKNWDVS